MRKKTSQDKGPEEIRTALFSLNIDKDTSKTNKGVLGVLVCYWSKKYERIVAQHLQVLELMSVPAESLFIALGGLFEKTTDCPMV